MNKFNRPVLLLLLIPAIFSASSCQEKAQTSNPESKFNPGHYVAVGPHFDLSEIKYLDEPALRGINKRFFWRTLEPEKDAYDFSLIETDLAYCADHNKQYVLFLCDKAFWIKGAMPAYLKQYEIDKGGGFTPIRWHPEFVERFIAIGKAIGDRFDTHPNFEGIAIQESALDMSEADLKKHAYSPEKYRDALISILSGLSDALPHSQVFWYQNGMAQNKGHLRQIADTMAGSNIIMGGPDILPHRRWLRHTYKIYGEYRDKLTLFCSAQDDSYKHHKNDVRISEKAPVHEEGYLTMEEIFLYGRDHMHIQYLFWNYYYEDVEKGARSYDDAIEVIRAYPRFNGTE